MLRLSLLPKPNWCLSMTTASQPVRLKSVSPTPPGVDRNSCREPLPYRPFLGSTGPRRPTWGAVPARLATPMTMPSGKKAITPTPCPPFERTCRPTIQAVSSVISPGFCIRVRPWRSALRKSDVRAVMDPGPTTLLLPEHPTDSFQQTARPVWPATRVTTHPILSGQATGPSSHTEPRGVQRINCSAYAM